MTSEHVTVTEEVQKDGLLITQERETIQHTADPHEDPIRNAAMGVTHPDYIPATERVYTYNEETGMSESKPRDSEVTPEPELDEDTDEEEEEVEEEEESEPTPPAPEQDFQPLKVEDDKPTTRRK